MKIAFQAKNGYCPEWTHDGVKYYLYEDSEGWSLMSKKIGFLKKDRFYKKGIKRVYPSSLLKRFFKNKKNVKYKKHQNYEFYYWQGKQFATDGKDITVQYECNYERYTCASYMDCLKDAKQYLEEKYFGDGQMSLFV